MRRNICVIGAILFLCGSCYAQAPTSDVQVPSITNSPLKLEDSTPVILRTKHDLSSAKVTVGVSGELLRGLILPANRAAKGRCLSLFDRTW